MDGWIVFYGVVCFLLGVWVGWVKGNEVKEHDLDIARLEEEQHDRP